MTAEHLKIFSFFFFFFVAKLHERQHLRGPTDDAD